MASKPWQDADTLRRLYVDDGLTQMEIAAKFDCSNTTISKWLNRHGIETNGTGPPIQYPELHDAEWLRERYVNQGMSSRDIADEVGVHKTAVLDGLRECGIERRGLSESTRLGMDTGHARFHTEKSGYEVSNSRGPERAWGVGIHRLVAIADGADPHTVFDGDHHVHHKNGIRWDNRPENLELKTNSEHMSEHAKEWWRQGTGWAKNRGRP